MSNYVAVSHRGTEIKKLLLIFVTATLTERGENEKKKKKKRGGKRLRRTNKMSFIPSFKTSV